MIHYLLQLDAAILLWVQENLRFSWLTPIMQFITSLNDYGIIVILTCVFLLSQKKSRKIGKQASCSLALSFIIANLLLKNLVARIRPFITHEQIDLITRIPHDLSFPSAHACSVFAVAGILFLTLPRKIGVPSLFLAALISFSRIYVGVHYPSDVIAGIVIGLICSYLIFKLDFR